MFLAVAQKIVAINKKIGQVEIGLHGNSLNDTSDYFQ